MTPNDIKNMPNDAKWRQYDVKLHSISQLYHFDVNKSSNGHPVAFLSNRSADQITFLTVEDILGDIDSILRLLQSENAPWHTHRCQIVRRISYLIAFDNINQLCYHMQWNWCCMYNNRVGLSAPIYGIMTIETAFHFVKGATERFVVSHDDVIDAANEKNFSSCRYSKYEQNMKISFDVSNSHMEMN